MDFDINRELAEDAAEGYADAALARWGFVNGWLWFCEGEQLNPEWGKSEGYGSDFTAGYIAARDAPDD